MKLSRKFDSTTVASNSILREKFSKCKLDNVTRYPKEWITELKPYRGDLHKFNSHIDDTEMMSHILSNVP